MQDWLIPSLAIVGGLVTLVFGGDLLVRGASLVAVSMKISPLVVGLTVVAFGTSAPELGVSLQAAYTGVADVAVGNVVGSNVLNVLLILGLAAMVAPLTVSSQLIRFDVPLLVIVSFIMWGLSLDGKISRVEGLGLASGLIAYIVYCIYASRREQKEVIDEYSQELPVPDKWTSRLSVQIAYIVVGLGMLAVGSKLLVSGAVTIAKLWDVSELIIGLTIVAAGTSLPEVVTSVVASYRGERDIAVGNVVGSNLFNIMCVLGFSSLLAPNPIPVAQAALQFDIPVMVAVAVLCLPIFFTGGVISRGEGALLAFYYAAYTVFLILVQTNPEVSHWMSVAFLYFVIPATVIGLLIATVASLRQPVASGT
jgi:cation:H+ antiporter